MSKQYLDKNGLTYLWDKLKAYFQQKLVSGTNIKTVNNQSLLGSGNINISGGGASFDYDIVDVEVDIGQISAHAQKNVGTVSVPDADRPTGKTLVGIVGVTCNNYRIVPYNYHVNGAHSIACAVVNTTAAQSAATSAMSFKLLYVNVG